jgi:peptidoglycan glycosyltransferase
MKARSLAVVLVILGIILLYFLVDRMIIGKDKYFKATYEDKAFVELIDSLISDGIFTMENGIVTIDEKALKARQLRKKNEERVRNSLPFLYIKNGKIYFDQQSVSISNNRVYADDRVLRGGFYDRNGILLAESTIDEKKWRQERAYRYGPEFFQILGYWSPVFGKRNLEKELDDYLSGRLHDPIQRKTSDPLKSLELGDNVALTLDSVVQRRAYDLMKDKKGAVVVLDVKTGEVIAAVSTPSFDPNEKERSRWRAAHGDTKGKPFDNRAFSALYPPGSTFKTVVASAWIERAEQEGMNNQYKTVCYGKKKNKYSISDIHTHGEISLDKAYSESCNVYFSEVGVMLGDAMLEYAKHFGFNRDINLMPGLDGRHFIATASQAFVWNGEERKDKARELIKGDFKRNPKIVAQGSIGQNIVTATPLQMAMVVSAVANRGNLMMPYIIREIRTGDGSRTLFTGRPIQDGTAIVEKTAQKLRTLMEMVMTSGTGKDVKKIYIEDGRYTTSPAVKTGAIVRVGGKTGTSEVGDRKSDGRTGAEGKPHSWFIGFAPADKPRFAIAVIAENQGFGSLTAAPVAMDVLAEALNSVRN